jgi:hypothetical protein
MKDCSRQPGAPAVILCREEVTSAGVRRGRTGKLRVRRDLALKKNAFPVEQYAAVKSFFDRARAGDEAQLVLAAKKRHSRLTSPRFSAHHRRRTD